jgi:hypothetical protein
MNGPDGVELGVWDVKVEPEVGVVKFQLEVGTELLTVAVNW